MASCAARHGLCAAYVLLCGTLNLEGCILKFKTLAMLCAMSFSAVAHVDIDPNDEYGYGQHDAQSFKFSVESCNEKVPVLLGNAQKKKFTQNDVSLFKVLHEKVMEENNVAKEAYRSGIKLVNMPPKNRARA